MKRWKKFADFSGAKLVESIFRFKYSLWNQRDWENSKKFWELFLEKPVKHLSLKISEPRTIVHFLLLNDENNILHNSISGGEEYEKFYFIFFIIF